MAFKSIVWDWNGTLLNDLQVGVDVLNDMLGRRGVAPLNVDEYKKVLSKEWDELPPIFITSSEKGTGRDEVLQYIEEINNIVLSNQ